MPYVTIVAAKCLGCDRQLIGVIHYPVSGAASVETPFPVVMSTDEVRAITQAGDKSGCTHCGSQVQLELEPFTQISKEVPFRKTTN